MRCPSGPRTSGEHISRRHLWQISRSLSFAYWKFLPSLVALIGPTDPNPPIFFEAGDGLLPPT